MVMRIVILSLTIFLGLISCRKDKMDVQDFVECSMSQKFDSTAIAAKLIGSWTWKKQSIANTNKFRNADKNIKVTFNADATFSMTENSNVVLQSS
jgi:hypothetical protein